MGELSGIHGENDQHDSTMTLFQQSVLPLKKEISTTKTTTTDPATAAATTTIIAAASASTTTTTASAATTTTTTASAATTPPTTTKPKTVHTTPLLPPVPSPSIGLYLSAYLPSVPAFLLSLVGAQVLFYALFKAQPLEQQGQEILSMMAGTQVATLQVAAKLVPLVLLLVWQLTRQPQVYLMELATFKAPDSWRVSHEDALQIARNAGRYTEESMAFMEQIVSGSGMGQATAVPPAHQALLRGDTKPDMSIEATRKEAQTVFYGIIEEVLNKAGITAQDIDILVINCSLFTPTPSLSAMVASKFQMRPDLTHFTLGGMGCSAGLISLDLAQKLLKQRPNSRALVLSTEILTQALYQGNDRAFLVQNMLFRCGASCVLLSNRPFDAYRAKFQLRQVVRSLGTDPVSFETVYCTEDKEGFVAVRLSKYISKVAGRMLQINLNTMAPQILPLTELTRSLVKTGLHHASESTRGFAKSKGWDRLAAAIPQVQNFKPDISTAVDHFCVHAGGRAITDGVQKALNLTHKHMEPSVATFHDYGNLSSASVWYELEHVMNHGGVKRGDRVLQIAFGGGFKCNTAYWTAV